MISMRSAMRAEAVGLGERDAGVVLQVDEEGALVEGRQERARQQAARRARRDDADGDDGADSVRGRRNAHCSSRALPAFSLATTKLSPLPWPHRAGRR